MNKRTLLSIEKDRQEKLNQILKIKRQRKRKTKNR